MYIAIDQYGSVHKLKTDAPRKELLHLFGRSHADKIYVDLASGNSKHVGYVIAGYWLTVYKRCEK